MNVDRLRETDLKRAEQAAELPTGGRGQNNLRKILDTTKTSSRSSDDFGDRELLALFHCQSKRHIPVSKDFRQFVSRPVRYPSEPCI